MDAARGTGTIGGVPATLTRQILVDECAECRYRWMIGNRRKGQLNAKCHIDPGTDNCADQGVAAKTEEIVVSSDLRKLKSFRPDLGKQYLRFRSRFITLHDVNGKRELA